MRPLLALSCLVLLGLPGCLSSLTEDDAPGPRDYVSNAKYSKWVIELDMTEGQSIPNSALSLLQTRLNEVVNKPGGIEIRRDETLAKRGGTWSQDDLLQTAARTSDLKTKGDTVVLHLLVVDGTYEESNVLGVTYSRETSAGRVISTGPIVLFGDTIRNACGLLCLTSTEAIWQAVIVHEFGHALGLVDNGAPMQRNHEDPEHPGHSNNQASVMYYAVETTSITTVFQNGPPTQFDANDKSDLCALGGKCA